MEEVKVGIAATGSYIPEEVLTNRRLVEILALSGIQMTEEKIVQVTGISERRIGGSIDLEEKRIVKGLSSGDYAFRAILPLFADPERLRPEEVEFLYLASSFHDTLGCPTAGWVHKELREKVAGFPSGEPKEFLERGKEFRAADVSAGCSGWLFALTDGVSAIQTGRYNCGIVAAGEAIEKFTDFTQYETADLFGGAGGAVALKRCKKPGYGILAYYCLTDGTGAPLLYVPAGGARKPATLQTIENREHFLHMEGKPVFQLAIKTLDLFIRGACQKAGVKIEDVDLWLFHQANDRINYAVAERVGIDPNRILSIIYWTGNTSSSSIPLLLDIASKTGRLKEGMLIALFGFGAGLTWGAVFLVWGGF